MYVNVFITYICICRYTTNKELLTKNFEVVGKGDEEIPLVKESDAAFSLWATGRQNCNGMAVVIKVPALYRNTGCLCTLAPLICTPLHTSLI